MKFGIVAIPVLALAFAGATPAQAQTVEKNSYAHASIMKGDYAAAERKLRADARSLNDGPEVDLNLAVVLMQTHRFDEARALYRHVLTLDPVEMDLANGSSASSHDIARRGLALLNATTKLASAD